MPDCNGQPFLFPSFDRRKIEASFQGGEVSSDGGVMLLRQADRRLGLTQALDTTLPAPRDAERISHPQLDLLRPRIYGIALGYEDLNDHDTRRHDLAWQTAVERDEPLASSPTLCRLEARASRRRAVALHAVRVEPFIRSFKSAPTELGLDFDATDDRVHGLQEGRFFHGYDGDGCFLPLYVFCGEPWLVSYLRPSNLDAARHAWAILKLLVARLRQAWPAVKIVFSGDSGFCRGKMLRWCERHGVDDIVGLAKNPRFLALAEPLLSQAAAAHQPSGDKQRLFGWLDSSAATWDRPRRVIAQAEHSAAGSNPRFVLTSLPGDAQALYDEIDCARGEMENRIQEQPLGLFADRPSCHGGWANPLRLLLSSASYVLLEAIRRLGLAGSELCHAQAGTIRLRLLKIGTVIERNTRRIRLLLSSAYPHADLLRAVVVRLSSG